MKILGIIPSRYASTRFPGKPLIDVAGKTMIRRVYEQSMQSKGLNEVVVATDDQRIADEVLSFGGKVEMTSEKHRNGTERCAEVLERYPEYDYVVNIQGDEPFIKPQQLDGLCDLLDGHVQLGSMVKKLDDPALLDNPSIMKVILNRFHEAIYFSRTAVPYVRDYPKEEWLKHHTFYKHICIYAYRSDILFEITNLPPGELEMSESLEQLRWIENGYKIKIGITEFESHSVDTPQDLERILKTI
ncbi:MAG: 3-deoxy-manno-octulosonate cytidylyltransferase [Bacteroidota bacterium]